MQDYVQTVFSSKGSTSTSHADVDANPNAADQHPAPLYREAIDVDFSQADAARAELAKRASADHSGVGQLGDGRPPKLSSKT